MLEAVFQGGHPFVWQCFAGCLMEFLDGEE